MAATETSAGEQQAMDPALAQPIEAGKSQDELRAWLRDNFATRADDFKPASGCRDYLC